MVILIIIYAKKIIVHCVYAVTKGGLLVYINYSVPFNMMKHTVCMFCSVQACSCHSKCLMIVFKETLLQNDLFLLLTAHSSNGMLNYFLS